MSLIIENNNRHEHNGNGNGIAIDQVVSKKKPYENWNILEKRHDA